MITIRKARKKDIKAIRTLVGKYPRFLMKETPKVAAFFVAEEEGHVIGCCALDVYSERLAEVRSLAVANRHRNRGVATVLVNRCLEEARQRGIQEILAITSRERLFKRLGFGPFHKEKFALFKVLKEGSKKV
jgi:amino-acid N-acetyltransferase